MSEGSVGRKATPRSAADIKAYSEAMQKVYALGTERRAITTKVDEIKERISQLREEMKSEQLKVAADVVEIDERIAELIKTDAVYRFIGYTRVCEVTGVPKTWAEKHVMEYEVEREAEQQ